MCSPRRRSTNVRSSPSRRTPGHTTASLLIARLHASSWQSTLAKALHEPGRLLRTIYICRYVVGEELRRRVRRQLSKGQNLHTLRRDLFFAHQGHVRRDLDDQTDQELCLTLVTYACVLWTTAYAGDALDSLRSAGVEVSGKLPPTQHDHINFYLDKFLSGQVAELLWGLGQRFPGPTRSRRLLAVIGTCQTMTIRSCPETGSSVADCH